LISCLAVGLRLASTSTTLTPAKVCWPRSRPPAPLGLEDHQEGHRVEWSSLCRGCQKREPTAVIERSRVWQWPPPHCEWRASLPLLLLLGLLFSEDPFRTPSAAPLNPTSSDGISDAQHPFPACPDCDFPPGSMAPEAYTAPAARVSHGQSPFLGSRRGAPQAPGAQLLWGR
jgi:hypothetical protein